MIHSAAISQICPETQDAPTTDASWPPARPAATRSAAASAASPMSSPPAPRRTPRAMHGSTKHCGDVSRFSAVDLPRTSTHFGSATSRTRSANVQRPAPPKRPQGGQPFDRPLDNKGGAGVTGACPPGVGPIFTFSYPFRGVVLGSKGAAGQAGHTTARRFSGCEAPRSGPRWPGR
jgi:hypothetical protein